MSFKAGDRVNVYGFTYDGTSCLGWAGEVTHAVGEIGGPLLHVRLDGRTAIEGVHPKQCRKLVKKERRRIWIDCSVGLSAISGRLSNQVRLELEDGKEQFAEFVEVRRRK